MAPPAAPPAEINPTLRWAVALSDRPRGFSMAREPHLLLAWDDQNWLTLINARGNIQAKRLCRGAGTGTGAGDVGSSFAAVGSRGEVWWMGPDLMPRWARPLPTLGVTAAMDAYGRYLAASDSQGNLHIFDRDGKTVCRVQ